MSARSRKTEDQLEDESIVAAVRGYLTVQAADWRRRKLNTILPRVLEMVDEARNQGLRVDTAALIKQVWHENDPLLELS